MRFLDKTCTISGYSITTDSWEEFKSYSTVYSWIACDFYQASTSRAVTEYWKDDSIGSYTIILEWDKTLVRAWMKATISTMSMNLGSYEIESVQPYQDISWNIDNIELKAKRIDA